MQHSFATVLIFGGAFAYSQVPDVKIKVGTWTQEAPSSPLSPLKKSKLEIEKQQDMKEKAAKPATFLQFQ